MTFPNEIKEMYCEVCGNPVIWEKFTCICFGHVVWIQESGLERAVRKQPVALCRTHLPEEDESEVSEISSNQVYCATGIDMREVQESFRNSKST